MEHVASGVKQAVSHVHQQGYFEPLCTERHLSVRHNHWDFFKYAGDVSHLLALALCIAVVLRESGTEGVSFKTHLLFFVCFTCRFSNVFFCDQSIFLIIYKVLLWTCTLKIVIFMWALGSREDPRDTLPMIVVIGPTVIFTIVFGVYSLQDHGLLIELLWIFSTYLESVAMLPQYIYCYRDSDNDSGLVSFYVLTMGGYRMVFGLSWIYQYLALPYYLDVSSFISGVLGIIFFCDYLYFKFWRVSTLSHFCISMDDTIREAEVAAHTIVAGGENILTEMELEMERLNSEVERQDQDFERERERSRESRERSSQFQSQFQSQAHIRSQSQSQVRSQTQSQFQSRNQNAPSPTSIGRQLQWGESLSEVELSSEVVRHPT